MLDEATVHEFLGMQERWCNLRNCTQNPEMHAEDMAVREALLHFKQFNLFGICVRINGKIEGFAVGEKLNQNTFVEHFEKGNTEFKGIYQYVLNQFAKHISSQFEFLNREQDLGVEGLRKSKLSYYPAFFVEKYIVKNK